MQSILEKLNEEEIKQLSKEINKVQKDFFGNSLSLRKQESFMAKVFNVKNWSTLLGLSNKKRLDKEYKEDSEYQKTTIQIEILSNGLYNNPNDLKTVWHDITYGDCSGSIKLISRESLDADEVSQALKDQGSDPNFLISLDTETKEILDDVWQEVNRLLKYDHQLEDSSEDEKIELLLDYCQRYVEDKKIHKAEIIKYLEDSF